MIGQVIIALLGFVFLGAIVCWFWQCYRRYIPGQHRSQNPTMPEWLVGAGLWLRAGAWLVALICLVLVIVHI